MRVSLVVLAALAGHSVAVPCKPKWVVSKSKSWMSASTRLDKVLAELPTIYADGGIVPPNATAIATRTVAGDEGDLSATTAGVARNRHVSSTPNAGAATASSGTPSAGADRSADVSDPTSTVTTTTTTITVTPSVTGLAAASAASAAAKADEASTKADKVSTEEESPKGHKMPRRGCPHRKVCPHRQALPPVTYRTVTEVIPPASTPVVVVYKHVPCTKNNKMHRRSFEGSKEEQKDLDMLSMLAESKMGEAINMQELYDKSMEAFEAKEKALSDDKKALGDEKKALKKQSSEAKSLMKEARDWDKKLHNAVREYNLKQQKWEEDMEKKEEEAKKKEEEEKEKKEKRDGSSYVLSKDEKTNKKREPYFLSKEQYEDKIYKEIGEKLKKSLAKNAKEHDKHIYAITKKYKFLKCDNPNGCKGKEISEAQQGVLDSKVKKEDEEIMGEEKKETKQEGDAEEEKTEKAEQVELEEGEDEEVELLADGDEHEQYVRLSTLYMQYRKLLAEGIQKKLDPVLKNDKYAGNEIEGEHEKGDGKEQLRRLTNLYLDFRYMLVPKFKKQLDPILHEGNL
ncbi:uncharacterized protein QYS62_004766 [Fusarium acuminatum]|uniref:Uncharacterized protein n=1 Tax=Fusarium acuminatum TaxID=5515 RepID=A0ABZ2WSN4_9HYPO